MKAKKTTKLIREESTIVDKKHPIGVSLLRTLPASSSSFSNVVWSLDGRILAYSSRNSATIADAVSGHSIRSLETDSPVISLALNPTGTILLTGGRRGARLWDIETGRSIRRLGDTTNELQYVSWSRDGRYIALCADELVRIFETEKWSEINSFSVDKVMLAAAWDYESKKIAVASYHSWICDAFSGETIHQLSQPGGTYEVAWSPPNSALLAAGTSNQTVEVWDAKNGTKLLSLEGHTEHVRSVAFSSDGSLLASAADDGVRIWDCQRWREVAKLSRSKSKRSTRIAFHPTEPLIAVSSRGPTPVEIYKLDVEILLAKRTAPVVKYTSAKVVVVGDSGVGKTGLGWRLAHSEFKEHASTHGQQFWLLDELSRERNDGTQCEAVLWDLAGQDDYRLIHALFLDDTDLALVLFDPSRPDDPLGGAEFWLKQLNIGTHQSAEIPSVLVAARADRGTPRFSPDEMNDFCRQRGIKAYLQTSAKTGEGVQQLIGHMQNLIRWDEKAATVTTETFKRIKDFVLDLKENPRRRKVIFTPDDLRKRLSKTDVRWKFTDDQMLTAVRHLETHGYVTRLKTSSGDLRILLSPELLNNLAASFVLEARRNRRGLGALKEEHLLAGRYKFPEIDDLTDAEKAVLLDSATSLFLDHNVCFRETDPLVGKAYLVFPELINLKRPSEDQSTPVIDGAAYTVSGAVENAYASIVVLMGYTQTFTRTNQWQNQARYEVGNGQVCGFRLDAERPGELDLVLYFGIDTAAPTRMLFQGIFESLIARRKLTVKRFEPTACSNGHILNRVVLREQIAHGANFAFCSRCGERIALPRADQPIQLSPLEVKAIEKNRRAADDRSRFEQVLFRLKTYVTEQKITAPECFISYAWGRPANESWVERLLATDLQKSGLMVVLDRWENARIGASVPRFVERVAKSDRVIVVGTPLYKEKYENNQPMRGYVVAAEGDLIGKRMIGTEAQKESVLPILLEGTEESAFPAILQGRVYADFRAPEAYFGAALELLLSIYDIQPSERIASDLRDILRNSKDLSQMSSHADRSAFERA